MNAKLFDISEFKITQISGNGRVYVDDQPMDGRPLNGFKAVDLRQLEFSRRTHYFRSDDHTAFEFYYAGSAFTVLPDSTLAFNPKTGETCLFSGEYHWDERVNDKSGKNGKNDKNRKRATLTIASANGAPGAQTLVISGSGRIRMNEGGIEIRNYRGTAVFDTGRQRYEIRADQAFIVAMSKNGNNGNNGNNDNPIFSRLLPMPRTIDPVQKIVTLTQSDDSVVRFEWNAVPEASQYVFRLYSSDLKEMVLTQKQIGTHHLEMDLLSFDEKEFYWDVAAFDPSTQNEGAPSALGHIRFTGALLEKKSDRKAPALVINDFTVNGNLVLIKGEADVNSQLYINGQVQKIDPEDGQFICSLTLKSLGYQKITFRLVSPSGVETNLARYVTISEE
ncbi:MAG: hypothetical protein ACM3SY_14330 [Candidatus Omnitrophota bacterium]